MHIPPLRRRARNVSPLIAVCVIALATACSSGGQTVAPLPAAPGSGSSGTLGIASPSPAATVSVTPLATVSPAPTSAATATAVPTAVPTAAPTAAPTLAPTAAPVASIPFATNIAIDSASPTDPNFGQWTLPFGALGSTATLTIAPAGGTYALALDPATCGSGAATVVTVTQLASASFAIASLNAGVCAATMTSAGTLPTRIWFTVNLTGFSVQ